MKVKQLIRELKKMPQSSEVEVAMHDNTDYEGSPVVSVEYIKKTDIDTDTIMDDDMGMYNAASNTYVLIRC